MQFEDLENSKMPAKIFGYIVHQPLVDSLESLKVNVSRLRDTFNFRHSSPKAETLKYPLTLMNFRKPTEVRQNEQHYNMKRSSWDVRTLLEVFSREFTHKVSKYGFLKVVLFINTSVVLRIQWSLNC